MKTICLLLFSLHLSAHTIPILQDSEWNKGQGYNNCTPETNGEYFLLHHYLRPGQVVFDIGGNIGAWSLRAYKAEPDIRLFSFEPNPKIFDLLQFSLSPFSASCFPIALSDYQGRGDLFCSINNNSELNGIIYRSGVHSQKKSLPVIVDTLDHFCKEHGIERIDLLKIDTEGSEYAVLLGAKDLLHEKRIRAIQFEYGTTYLHAHITLEEVFKLLTDEGYAIYRILPTGLLPISHWEASLENYFYANYFAHLQIE